VFFWAVDGMNLFQCDAGVWESDSSVRAQFVSKLINDHDIPLALAPLWLWLKKISGPPIQIYPQVSQYIEAGLSFSEVYAAHQVGVEGADAVLAHRDGAPSGWARAWGERLGLVVA
jgi:hypothetical protein